MSDRKSKVPLPDRSARRTSGTCSLRVVQETDDQEAGIAAARRVYYWPSKQPGPGRRRKQRQAGSGAAKKIIDGLAKRVTQDRTSLMALTALKYDNYTFTHMVNVSALAMARARALNIEGNLLREFGFAALMHDIGKVNTPLEVLNKPDKLNREEFDIMKRHVVDGARIAGTPEMPALAPIVAFEHHLKQDLTGYPEDRQPQAEPLHDDRQHRGRLRRAAQHATLPQGPGDRSHPQHHGRAGQPGVQPVLLKRFVNLMGLFRSATSCASTPRSSPSSPRSTRPIRSVRSEDHHRRQEQRPREPR
jgi:putative nucleotidyltransferase with HDIG domain